MKADITNDTFSEIILYPVEEGKYEIALNKDSESIWLNLNQIAELYQTSKANISMHIHNILKDGELTRKATVKNYLTVQIEKGRQVHRNIRYYNLDMILAIGYRVRSERGIQFRIWATQHLSEFLHKGFILDDERLKGNDRLTDYFDELLARIRDIRASEKRAYLRVREIFALAIDYKPNSKAANKFFATMQNKMHYAATGMTAAEIIATRANAQVTNMGLTNWKGNIVRKEDVSIAKNYLTSDEIDILNRIVNMFLEQAEFRTLRKQQIYTKDWEKFLDKFLMDNELPILYGSGKITHNEAKELAENAYNEFELRRRKAIEDDAEAKYLADLTKATKLVSARRKKR
jgi:hypothetical protein